MNQARSVKMRACISGHVVEEGAQQCGQGHELALTLPCPQDDCEYVTTPTAQSNFVAAVELLKIHQAGSHGRGREREQGQEVQRQKK